MLSVNYTKIRMMTLTVLTVYTGWPKKVSHHQFKKIVLKIANEIRFLRKVKV